MLAVEYGDVSLLAGKSRSLLGPSNQRPEPPGIPVWGEWLIAQAELPRDSPGEPAVMEVDGPEAVVTDGSRELLPCCGMFRGVEVRLEQSKMLIRDTFSPDSLECPAVVVGRAKFLIVHRRVTLRHR